MKRSLFIFLSLLVTPGLSDTRGCLEIISSLVDRPSTLNTAHSRLDTLEKATGRGSLLDYREKLSTKSIKRHNNELLDALKEPAPVSDPDKVFSLNKQDANFLVDLLRKHPTNGEKHEKKYDPEECYGFCFGRATLIHNEALRRNMDPESIKKIWAVGSLEKGKWHFHVATMIKAKGKGSWWVCDPVYSVAISAEEWIRRMRHSSDDSRMMVFVTDPRRFSVYDPKNYTAIDLLGDGKSDFYNGYFKDYLEHVQTEAQPKPFKN